jgi:hypothetical protein
MQAQGAPPPGPPGPYNNGHAPLQSSPHSAHHIPHTHTLSHPDPEPADSDDGQNSADDLDNDDDHDVTRLGKRKRPISVS